MKNLTEEQKKIGENFKNNLQIMTVIRDQYYHMTSKFLKRNIDINVELVAISRFLTVNVFSVNNIYVIVDNFGPEGFVFHNMTKSSLTVKKWFLDFETKFEFYSDESYFSDIENFN